MAEILEILNKLLSTDTNAINAATQELELAWNNPHTVASLCDIIVSDCDIHIRQYAAVILRKRLGKLRNWNMVLPEHQEVIKKGMLEALVNEKEKSVRTAVAHLVGVIVRHDAENWMSTVLQFIYSNIASADPVQCELGSSTFATLTDVAPDQFVNHMDSVCQMFSAALASAESTNNITSPTILSIIVGMTHLLPFVLGHNAAEQTYGRAVPYILKSLSAFSGLSDPDPFIKAFDILENMADYTPRLLTPNVKMLIHFCLQLSGDETKDNAVRVKAISFIGWLVKLKKKAFLKENLLEPTLDVIFKLMAAHTSNEDDDEDYYVDEDESTPMTAATQTLDLIALNLPSEKVLRVLSVMIWNALQDDTNPYRRRAGYLAMAVIAEGCSEYIQSHFLDVMLEAIGGNGILDSKAIARNAAFFALGQFSEHLQPKILDYASKILPIMFQFLDTLCNELQSNNKEPKHIERMFYALETFVGSLSEKLEPYLNDLMIRLFKAMNPQYSAHLRELAMSSVSAVANAVEKAMMPYFPELINILRPYLSQKPIIGDSKIDEENFSLRIQSIDTLGTLARTVGKDIFKPLTKETMDYALDLLQSTDDPELCRAAFNLLGSLAYVVDEEMGQVFPQIMEKIFEAVLAVNEIITNEKDVEDDVEDENIEEDIESSDDEEEFQAKSLENAYLLEKEDAILAIKEFAEHSGSAFHPYLGKAFENVFKVIDHPAEDIRSVSLDALFKIVSVLYKNQSIDECKYAIQILMPKTLKIVEDDEEVYVVIRALENMSDIMTEIKELALYSEDLREAVFFSICNVVGGKTACQSNDPADNDDSSEENSDFEERLIEVALNMVPAFGKAMSPQAFNGYFTRIYKQIIQKLEKAKEEDLQYNRSFAYGCLADCFDSLQQCSAIYFNDLLPILLDGLQDSYEQCRQNAVFGLGELVLYSGEVSFSSYPVILQYIAVLFEKESVIPVVDNIVGTVARLMITNLTPELIQKFLPVFLNKLPLKDDTNENLAVFRCFKLLYLQSRNSIIENIDQILHITLHVLSNKEYKEDETYENAFGLLNNIRTGHPEVFNNFVSANQQYLSYLHTLPFN